MYNQGEVAMKSSKNEDNKNLTKDDIADVVSSMVEKKVIKYFFLFNLGIVFWISLQFFAGAVNARRDVVAGMGIVKAAVKMEVAGWRFTDQFTLERSKLYNCGYRLYILTFTDYQSKSGVARLYENLKIL